MIALDALANITRVITHGPGCADGMASALLMRRALPGVSVEFVQYNTPEQIHMKAEPGMAFVDFSPHPDRVQDFVDVGAIVLDHHRGTEPIVRRFGERGVFADEKRDPGISGAALVWSEVLFPLRWSQRGSWDLLRVKGLDSTELFAQLVGIRDTWQKGDMAAFEDGSRLSEVLCFMSFEHLARLDILEVLTLRHTLGKTLADNSAREAQETAERAMILELDGRRVAVFQGGSTLTSNVADLVDVDLVAGFHYGADSRGRWSLRWSLRSRDGRCHCGELAQRYGGNGHTASAGFKLAVQDGSLNPFALAAWLFAPAPGG